MIMVPAAALGALVVFGIGYLLTSTVLTKFAKKTRSIPTLSRGVWKEVWQLDESTEKHIDEVSKIGGGIAIALMIFLILAFPKNWGSAILMALTIVGIIFGLLTFVLREPESDVEIGAIHTPIATTRASLPAKDELYQKLLSKTRNDKDLVVRLIEYERKRMPYANEETLLRNAIERWEQDRR